MTTRIEVPSYIRQWLMMTKNGQEDGPVRFNESENLYHVILGLTTLRTAATPMVDRGNLEIVIPTPRHGKNPLYYNYLSPRAARIIVKMLKQMFYIEARSFIAEKESRGIPQKTAVYMFISQYGMDDMVSEDALVKDYYRWRKKFLRKECPV